MKNNLYIEVADFIRGFRLDDCPQQVVKQAKKCLVDLIGCIIAGSMTRGAQIFSSFVENNMSSPRECTVIKLGRKANAVGASLANGFSANALDFDDGHSKAKGHPGAVILPCVLAVGETRRVTGKELLEALIVGYEVGIRAGIAQHSANQEYFGSGSWASIGAAAGAAKILELDTVKTMHALGIAEGYAPMTPTRMPASMVPKSGVAWGAMVGTAAALLAKGGAVATPSLLNTVHFGSSLVDTLGKDFEIMNLYFKRYCCCHYLHAAIDGLLNVMKRNNISASEIKKITVSTFAAPARFQTEWPDSIEEAQYNLVYCLSAAAVAGNFGLEQLLNYAEARENEEIRAVKEKIEVKVSPELEARYPEEHLASVTVLTERGKIYDSGIIKPKGVPTNPLTFADIKDKFFEITRGLLDSSEQERIIAIIDQFEKQDVSSLLNRLK